MYTKILDLAQKTPNNLIAMSSHGKSGITQVGAGQRRGEGDPSLEGPSIGDPADFARAFSSAVLWPAEIVCPDTRDSQPGNLM
jgi:hypothetical protein